MTKTEQEILKEQVEDGATIVWISSNGTFSPIKKVEKGIAYDSSGLELQLKYARKHDFLMIQTGEIPWSKKCIK